MEGSLGSVLTLTVSRAWLRNAQAVAQPSRSDGTEPHVSSFTLWEDCVRNHDYSTVLISSPTAPRSFRRHVCAAGESPTRMCSGHGSEAC